MSESHPEAVYHPPNKVKKEFHVRTKENARGGRHRRRLGRSEKKSVTVDDRYVPSQEPGAVRQADIVRAGLGLTQFDRTLGAGKDGLVVAGKDGSDTIAVKVSDTSEEAVLAAQRETGLHETVTNRAHIIKLIRGRNVTKYRRGKEIKAHVQELELAEKGSLDKLLREKGHLSLGQTVDIGAQMAVALEDLQREGIVHSDVKPANIFVKGMNGNRYDVALGDLGIAGPPGKVDSDTVALTVAYAPLEKFTNEPKYVSDIYSLGAVLYELATGERLFSPKGKTDNEFMYERFYMLSNPERYNNYIRSKLEKIGAGSPEMMNLLSHMLAAEPGDRPDAQTVKQHLFALSRKFMYGHDVVLPRAVDMLRQSEAETVSLRTTNLHEKTEKVLPKCRIE